MDMQPSTTGQTSERIDRSIVTFRLDKQIFALPIEPVRQIIEIVKMLPVPQMQSYIEGVINFHGTVVPVLNLRTYLNLQPIPLTLHTPIILVYICEKLMGLLVDEVLDVPQTSSQEIIHPAHFLPDDLGEMPILTGIVQSKDGMVMLLNLDKLFQPEQVRLLLKAASLLAQENNASGEKEVPAAVPEQVPTEGTVPAEPVSQPEPDNISDRQQAEAVPASQPVKQVRSRSRKKLATLEQTEKEAASSAKQEKEP